MPAATRASNGRAGLLTAFCEVLHEIVQNVPALLCLAKGLTL